MGTWSFSPALSSVGLTATTSNNNVTIKVVNTTLALAHTGQITATFKDDDGCTKDVKFTLKNCGSSPSSSCDITGLTIAANTSGEVMIGKLPKAYYDSTTRAGGVNWSPTYVDWLGSFGFQTDTTETDYYPIVAHVVQANTSTSPRSVTISATCANGDCEGCPGGTFTVTQEGTGGGGDYGNRNDTFIYFKIKGIPETLSINSRVRVYFTDNTHIDAYQVIGQGYCNTNMYPHAVGDYAFDRLVFFTTDAMLNDYRHLYTDNGCSERSKIKFFGSPLGNVDCNGEGGGCLTSASQLEDHIQNVLDTYLGKQIKQGAVHEIYGYSGSSDAIKYYAKLVETKYYNNDGQGTEYDTISDTYTFRNGDGVNTRTKGVMYIFEIVD